MRARCSGVVRGGRGGVGHPQPLEACMQHRWLARSRRLTLPPARHHQSAASHPQQSSRQPPRLTPSIAPTRLRISADAKSPAGACRPSEPAEPGGGEDGGRELPPPVAAAAAAAPHAAPPLPRLPALDPVQGWPGASLAFSASRVAIRRRRLRCQQNSAAAAAATAATPHTLPTTAATTVLLLLLLPPPLPEELAAAAASVSLSKQLISESCTSKVAVPTAAAARERRRGAGESRHARAHARAAQAARARPGRQRHPASGCKARGQRRAAASLSLSLSLSLFRSPQLPRTLLEAHCLHDGHRHRDVGEEGGQAAQVGADLGAAQHLLQARHLVLRA